MKMKFTPELARILFRHLEPLVEARWSKEKPLLDAGYAAGYLKMKFKESEIARLGSAEELKLFKSHEIEYLKFMMVRYVGVEYSSELGLELAKELDRRRDLRRAAPAEIQIAIESERRRLWGLLDHEYKTKCAQEVVRFSTQLSRAETDEEVFSKVLENFTCTLIPYAYEDTLQKRVDIIKTLIEQELGPSGFEFDKKLSSIKSLVYCKPLHEQYRFFVSTERSSLNPKKIESVWPLGFIFGIHCLTNKWPPSGEWNDGGDRWTFRLGSFIPYGWVCGPRSLPEIEANLRFDLFAYKLIANEFESALRTGFAEAEAAGLITPD